MYFRRTKSGAVFSIIFFKNTSFILFPWNTKTYIYILTRFTDFNIKHTISKYKHVKNQAIYERSTSKSISFKKYVVNDNYSCMSICLSISYLKGTLIFIMKVQTCLLYVSTLTKIISSQYQINMKPF